MTSTVNRDTTGSLVDVVIRSLCDSVKAGKYKDGDRLPSNNELAEALNVSTLTVHRAIKQLEAQGVLICRRRHGKFFTNTSRMEIPQIQSGTIGLFLPDLALDFHLEMIKSLESRLSNAGKMLSINLTHTQPEKELRLLSTLLRNRLEALVYVTSPITASSPHLSREVKKWIDRYIQEGTYVIFADLSPIGLEQRLVSIDNVKAGQLLTEALIARGHKNIAFIGNPQHLSGQERYKGYSLAMRKARLDVDPKNYLHCKMDDPGLEQCFREFRSQHPKITGFVSDTQYSATCIKHVLECDTSSRLNASHCLSSFFEAFVPPFEAVAWIHIPGQEIGDATSEILLRVRSANDKPHRIMIEPKIWQVAD